MLRSLAFLLTTHSHESFVAAQPEVPTAF